MLRHKGVCIYHLTSFTVFIIISLNFLPHYWLIRLNKDFRILGISLVLSGSALSVGNVILLVLLPVEEGKYGKKGERRRGNKGERKLQNDFPKEEDFGEHDIFTSGFLLWGASMCSANVMAICMFICEIFRTESGARKKLMKTKVEIFVEKKRQICTNPEALFIYFTNAFFLPFFFVICLCTICQACQPFSKCLVLVFSTLFIRFLLLVRGPRLFLDFWFLSAPISHC